MAYGIQTFDRAGIKTMDTSSASWVQVAVLSIGKGDSASTVTFNGGSLPAGMQLRVALQVIDDLPTAEKQVVPTVSINPSTRVVTVQSVSSTTVNSEQETFPAYSAACTIIILGR